LAQFGQQYIDYAKAYKRSRLRDEQIMTHLFAIHTGFRLGEILNLRWEEVDLENAVIKMLARKNRRVLEVPLNCRERSVLPEQM
jgi:integrase